MEGGVWVKCFCAEYWCLEHDQHVSECPCPPVTEWGCDPYRRIESGKIDDARIQRILDQARSHIESAGR